MPADGKWFGRRAGRSAAGIWRGRRMDAIRRAVTPPGCRSGHHGRCGIEDVFAGVEDGGNRRSGWCVQQQCAAIVAVALARGLALCVNDRRQCIRHSTQGLPIRARQRPAGKVRLAASNQQQLQDEHVIVGGQFAIHAVGKCLGQSLMLENRCRASCPPVTLGEHWKSHSGGKQSRHLRDYMIVGRREAAPER